MSNMLKGTNNIMLDLETMGNGSFSAIVSLGAVRFNELEVTDEFYTVIDLGSSMKLGLKPDASTIMWWLSQSLEAQEELSSNPRPIEEVLCAFGMWVGEVPVVWGNGATFDNVILSNAYHLADIRRPWKYKNDRCYRTVKAMYPEVPYVEVGIYHKGVDDARSQALTLINCLSEN